MDIVNSMNMEPLESKDLFVNNEIISRVTHGIGRASCVMEADLEKVTAYEFLHDSRHRVKHFFTHGGRDRQFVREVRSDDLRRRVYLTLP